MHLLVSDVEHLKDAIRIYCCLVRFIIMIYVEGEGLLLRLDEFVDQPYRLHKNRFIVASLVFICSRYTG